MEIDFKGQTVLITGATGGIGAQLAKDFAKRGARLILTGTKPTARFPKRSGGFTTYYAVDFTDPASINAFLKKLAAHKRIDVLINNAGANVNSAISEVADTDIEHIMAVNLAAPFKITRAVSARMKKQRSGRIVNIASIWSVISKPNKSIYTASKFGIRGLTVASAIDLAPYNILVNSVSPGLVATDMTKRMMGKKGIAEFSKRIPLGRVAQPVEISKVVQFLASRENSYITGQNIVVDGGFVIV